MAGFTQPGETIRLSGPWDTGVGGSASSNGWAIQAGGNLPRPTNSAPLGWTVSIVSGSFGAADLVVDVTLPDPLTITNSKGGTYDISVRFDHSNVGATSTRSGFFPISVTSLLTPNDTKFDCASHPAGFYIAAVLESDGVHFWRVDDTIAGKVELSTLEGSYPSIWFDGRGALWCLLSEYADPHLTDDVVWNLYRSDNKGRTWETPLPMPWTSPRGLAQMKGGTHNSMIAVAAPSGGPTAGYFRRSHDNGATWTDGVNTGAAVGYQSYPFQLVNAAMMYPHRVSRDFGRTWNTEGSFFPTPIGADLNALNFMHTAPAQRSGSALMWMYTGNVFSTGKIQCGRSRGLGGHVIANSDVDDSNDEWFQIVSIPKTWESSTWKITNGRDRQYKSDDLGQTWVPN